MGEFVHSSGGYNWAATVVNPIEFGPSGFVNLISPKEPTVPSYWSIDLCRDWKRIASVEAYQFKGILRRLDGGEWTLSTSPAGVSGGQYLKDGDIVPFDPRDVNTLRLVAEGQIVFPGVMLDPERDQFRIEQTAEGERWEWTGQDAGWGYLDKRLAFPNPATEPSWVVSHDTRTGVASNVISAYIHANMGTGALAARTWGSGVAINDTGAGTSYTFSARLQTLKELVRRIALDAGIEVIPTVDFSGALSILIDESRDLSEGLVLSDQGDLSKSTMMTSPKGASFVLSAGKGELATRDFRIADDGSIGRNRLEILSDQSSMDSVSELQADASRKLFLNEESYAISSELTPEQTALAIGFGLRLGDRLSVIVKGRRYRVPIESFSFEIDSGQQVMRPQFGTAIPGRLASLLKKIERAARQTGGDGMVA